MVGDSRAGQVHDRVGAVEGAGRQAARGVSGSQAISLADAGVRRTSVTTWSPPARSEAVRALPIRPDAPVTAIFMAAPVPSRAARRARR